MNPCEELAAALAWLGMSLGWVAVLCVWSFWVDLYPAMERLAERMYPECFGKRPFNIDGCCEGHVKIAAALTMDARRRTVGDLCGTCFCHIYGTPARCCGDVFHDTDTCWDAHRDACVGTVGEEATP